MARKQRRKKDEVKTDIFNSITSILKKYGYSKLGINMIAKEANIDKTVIYRHFGDYDNLITCYIEKNNIWVNLVSHESTDIQSFIKELLINIADEMINSEEFKQLIIWSLSDESAHTKLLVSKREKFTQSIFDYLKSYFGENNTDVITLAGLIISGIYYIFLNESIARQCHLDFKTEESKSRIKKSINYLIDTVFTQYNNNKHIEEVAIKALNLGIDLITIEKITGLEMEHIEKLVKAE